MRSESPFTDPTADLERALIDEYIRSRGYDPGALQVLTEEQQIALRRDASAHAASRLAELEARAHYVNEIHGDSNLKR
jgi:hypothetical protein